MRRLYEGEQFWLDAVHANRRGMLKYQLLTLPVEFSRRRNQAQYWLNENPQIEAGFLEDEFLVEYFTNIRVPHGRLYPGLWVADAHVFFRVDYPHGFPFLFIDQDITAYRLRTGGLKVLIPMTGVMLGYNIQFNVLNRESLNRTRNGGLTPFDRFGARYLFAHVEQAAGELRIQDAIYALTELMQCPAQGEARDFMEPGNGQYDIRKTYEETPVWGEYQITP